MVEKHGQGSVTLEGYHQNLIPDIDPENTEKALRVALRDKRWGLFESDIEVWGEDPWGISNGAGDRAGWPKSKLEGKEQNCSNQLISREDYQRINVCCGSQDKL